MLFTYTRAQASLRCETPPTPSRPSQLAQVRGRVLSRGLAVVRGQEAAQQAFDQHTTSE